MDGTRLPYFDINQRCSAFSIFPAYIEVLCKMSLEKREVGRAGRRKEQNPCFGKCANEHVFMHVLTKSVFVF